MSSWTHPTLGQFQFDEYWWSQRRSMPAFEVFVHPTGAIPDRRGEIHVCIYAVDASDTPSQLVNELLGRVIDDHRELIPKIRAALFAEFRGTGPKTGMWWHGAGDTILDAAADTPGPHVNHRIDSPDDLDYFLSPPGISIRESGRHVEPWSKGGLPVVEFGFSSPIDEEHGIGVLTDGKVIVGIGYSGDAGHFPGA
jgi:hypothetical protein